MKPAATIARPLRSAAADAARDPAAHGQSRTCSASPASARSSPPGPGLLHPAQSVDDLVDHAIGRVLDLFDLDTALPHRWREAEN